MKHLLVTIIAAVLFVDRFYSVIFLAVVLSLGQVLGQEAKPSGGPELLFGLDNVIDVHIRIEPEEWAKLQPPKGTKMDIDNGISHLRLKF